MAEEAGPGQWRDRALGFGAALAVAAVCGVSSLGLLFLGAYLDGVILLGAILRLIGIQVAYAGVMLCAFCLLVSLLGADLFAKLFLVRDKAITPEVERELTAMREAPATVPITAGHGVLRILAVKPLLWLDPDAYGDDTTPVVVVDEVEHRLPGWDPYDIVALAGTVEVATWLPLRIGRSGRQVDGSFSVAEGQVTAVVYRPSSLPELPGTLATVAREVEGDLSLSRLSWVTALLIGLGFVVWLAFS
ncbi:hypothetical protein AB0C01_18810 [Micromonospora sp. NPDC048905]|uniref:hypothetical protein n=1 Tax=unclassified Micromonospora TaxID=2617518 RepID=UPI0033F70E96